MEPSPPPPDFDRLREIFEAIPHCRELGLEVVSIAEGKGIIRLDYHKRLVGNPERGYLHGGAITTVLDTVAGMAVLSALPEDTPIATLDLRIDYLGPAAPGRPVLASAHCYRRTASVAFVRAIAYHDDPDEPIANGVATFMLSATGFSISEAARVDREC